MSCKEGFAIPWLCFRYCRGVVPVYLPKFSEKIPHIVIATVQAYLGDWKARCLLISVLSLADAVFIEIFYWEICPIAFLKKRQKYCSFSPTREARSRMYIFS